MKQIRFSQRSIKIMSVILATVLFVSMLPDLFISAGAVSYSENSSGGFCDYELYTDIKDNSDGTRELSVYGYPVKFVDQAGVLRKTSLELTENSDGSFVPACHPVSVSLPRTLGEGIYLEYGDLELVIVPITGEESRAGVITRQNAEGGEPASGSEKKGEKVSYTSDSSTRYEYSLTHTGLKEEIVVYEYTGQSIYRFAVRTGKSRLQRDGGAVLITDRAGSELARFGDVVIYTADGREGYGSIEFCELDGKGEYEIGIKIDPGFLSDPETVYPIVIDPSVEVNYQSSGSGAIEDVTIYSATTSVGTSGSIFAGLHSSYGKSRILMRFPYLSSALASLGIDPDCVLLSYVELRDVIPDSNALTVLCHEYNKTSPAWTESGNPSWTDVGTSYVGDMYDSCSLSYGNGASTGSGASFRYRFNITGLSKKWITGAADPSKGLVFKAQDSFENGTVYRQKIFASYNSNSSYRPTLTIIYSDRYKASSSDTAFYADTGNLQYRSNCYGYAIRALFTGDIENYLSYEQQPGEFSQDREEWPTFQELNQHIASVCAGDNAISGMMEVIELDMDEFGGTISGQAKYTSASQIPSASDYSNKRLILLVTGGIVSNNSVWYGYHFYVQNGDNTWSHKNGKFPAQNDCFGECLNHVSQLTNSNILDHLNEYYSQNNDYLFFWITLPANVENIQNEFGQNNSTPFTSFYFGDKGGSTIHSAGFKPIDTASVSGKIDYIGDIDIFSVTRSQSGQRTFSVTTGYESYPVTVEVMDEDGVTLGSVYAPTGSGSFSVTLSRGKLYYLRICAVGQTWYLDNKVYQVIIS